MSSYSVTTKHLCAGAPGILRWCLDYPQTQDGVSLDSLSQGVLFQGWVLTDSEAKLEVYVRHGEVQRVQPLTMRRPDVIEKVLKQSADDHAQLQCGFHFRLELDTAHCVLGFIVNGVATDFVEIQIAGTMGVLKGTAPWLFLDNDTNQSVAQFTGEITLNNQTLEGWQRYLQQLNMLTTPQQLAVLVAPNKEQVYPQFYPHTAARKSPMQQLLEYVQFDPQLIYPAAELASTDKRSFRYTDTHWSHYAAMTVSVLLAEKLGLDKADLTALFADDQYVERSVCGDLGNKLFPPHYACEELLSGFNYKRYLRYDNGLPNFGRVMLFENENALVAQHCLIYGASSSYSMLNYLVRIFAKVSIVHTAGNVDPTLIAALTPDKIICQTNERFIVRSPVADYSLAQTIQDKLAAMSAAQQQVLLEASALNNQAAHHRYFHALLAQGD